MRDNKTVKGQHRTRRGKQPVKKTKRTKASDVKKQQEEFERAIGVKKWMPKT